MKLISLMILIGSLSIASCFAGTEHGNGSDNYGGDYGAAWFLDETRTVIYCIDLDPAFGRPIAQIRSDIQASWAKWLDYVVKKHAYVLSDTPTWRFPKTLTEKSCDGNEDLRFRFGTEDAEVKQEKLNYELPSAISFRHSFDPKAGWAKGWVWFALPGVVDPVQVFPNWTDDLTFQSVLLHELGHVFGNVHVSGTIMSATLSDQLQNHQLKAQWAGKVDQTKELMSGGLTPTNSAGFLGGVGYFDLYRAFEWLTGRKAMGQITAKYSSSSLGGGQLMVKDDLEEKSYQFVLSVGMNNPSYSSDVPIFKRMRDNTNFSVFSMSGIQFGVIHHPTLGDVTAIFESGMSNTIDSIGPFGIKVLINGSLQPLFSGFPEN